MASDGQISVLIAGAGPTGLVLGLWLSALGIPVRMIDKVAEPGTTSRALGVQARTLELYEQLDLSGALVEAGQKVAGANLWVNGKKVARIPLERIGRGQSPYPYLLIYPQDQHERLLIERLAARGVTVERPVELLGFEEQTGHLTARLKHADGSVEMCEAEYLAGCDGAKSIVRETLGTGFPGGTYSQLFYVADVDASGPAADGELHVDLADSDFVALFPLKGKGKARFIGAVRPEQRPKDRPLTFDDVRDQALRQIKMTVEKVNWFSTYHVHHRVAEHFRERRGARGGRGGRGGRAFLLGDAAHIHSPVGGQGMNTGIGDAINLAWKLAAVIQRTAPEGILDTYEVERIAFARRLVETTDRIFTLATDLSPLVQQMRIRAIPLLMPALFGIPDVRRFLFRTVSQIGIRYRQSSLSESRAGAVHGGDRLPWIQLPAGGDNFAPLRAMRWQVHVYGEAQREFTGACAELGIPLHVFRWQTGMFKSRLRQNAYYLLRPDSYVALAGAKQDAAALRNYFKVRGIEPRAPAQ